MRSLVRCAVAAAAVLPATGGGRAAAAPRADHVVLVSIDGLRPEFYLDSGWPAPMLQQMAREGVHAEAVQSVFPSLTYPAHTTMVTGALPARHGVHYNRPFEPGGASGRWFWSERAVQVPTLWDAVRAAGGTTAAFNWPATVDAPIDWLVPEAWSIEPGVDDLAVLRAASRPPQLWRELEREATGRLTERTFSLRSCNARDIHIGDMAAYVFERHRPRLLAVHLLAADYEQHATGRDSPQVRRAVASVDRALASVVEAVARAGLLPRTAFVVAGDHGFVELHTAVAPNVWLVGAGLRSADRDRGAGWRASFHAGGGASFLHLADPADRDAEARVRERLAALPEPVRKRFRVVDREQLREYGAAPEAALALSGALGVHFVDDAAGEPVRRATMAGAHGYLADAFPAIDTGFVGWGAGFRPGVAAQRLQLVDLAPLVAALLGVAFDAPDGLLAPGLLARAEDSGPSE